MWTQTVYVREHTRGRYITHLYHDESNNVNQFSLWSLCTRLHAASGLKRVPARRLASLSLLSWHHLANEFNISTHKVMIKIIMCSQLSPRATRGSDTVGLKFTRLQWNQCGCRSQTNHRLSSYSLFKGPEFGSLRSLYTNKNIIMKVRNNCANRQKDTNEFLHTNFNERAINRLKL